MFTRIVESGDLFTVILVADPDNTNFRAFPFPLEPDKLYMGIRFHDTQTVNSLLVEYTNPEIAYFAGSELEEVRGVGLRLVPAKSSSQLQTLQPSAQPRTSVPLREPQTAPAPAEPQTEEPGAKPQTTETSSQAQTSVPVSLGRARP